MDKLVKLQLFAKVVETHSFTTAANLLGISRTTASKAIAELEQDLKTSLLHRSTRHISPTESGAEYYTRIQSILSDLQEAVEAVQSLTGQARGLIRINMPLSFGIRHIGDALTDFMVSHPALKIETHLTDRFVDPIQEGYDLTLRIADLEDSALMSRKLAPIHRVVCTSPDYLAKNGTPQSPKDLGTHNCLHYGNLATGTLWHFSNEKDQQSVRINGILCSNNAEILRLAAIKGQGIVFLPTVLVADDIAAGALVPLLCSYPISPVALYALYSPTKHQSTKLRLLIDFLAKYFTDMGSTVTTLPGNELIQS
ncbi:MAG TPA: LysR family transcriptional regulator [Rhizobiales bacterium]|nr:LysR family transcriptional regulator [Hyphomicrobiales bacterium]